MSRKASVQQTLASQGSFEKHGRKSKRELFLEQLEEVVPWRELSALVVPHYPKAGNGRQPVGLSIMLRTYFLQQWFNLSDPGMEEAFYESPVLRRFAGMDLGRAAAPDETTIFRFRHLLEKHSLGAAILVTVNWHLDARGMLILRKHSPSIRKTRIHLLGTRATSALGFFPYKETRNKWFFVITKPQHSAGRRGVPVQCA